MQDSNEIKERRKHPRSYLDLPLEYRFPDTLHSHGALVVNASEKGLLVYSIKEMPVGTKLNIVILFPNGFGLANLEVLAEIIWKDIQWQENWEGYRLGLKFVHIQKENQQKLKQLLAEGHEG